MKKTILTILTLVLLFAVKVYAEDTNAQPPASPAPAVQPAPAAPVVPSGTQSEEAKNLFYAPSPIDSQLLPANPGVVPPPPVPVPPPPVPPQPGQMLPPPPPVPVVPVLPGVMVPPVMVAPPVLVAPPVMVMPPAILVPAVPIGMKYRILLKDRDVIRNVNFHSFRGGQQIKLVFSANIDGFLYIIEHGSKGTRRLIFPDPRMNMGTNFVKAYMEYEVPADGFFVFDETTGKESLHVFLSPTPLSEFDLANLPGGIIPPPVWTRVETLIQRQQVGCTRNLQFADAMPEPPPPPMPPQALPVPVPPPPMQVVGVVPSVYVVQYAPMLYQLIELLHYR